MYVARIVSLKRLIDENKPKKDFILLKQDHQSASIQKQFSQGSLKV